MRHKATSATTVENRNTVYVYNNGVQKSVEKNLVKYIKKHYHYYHLTAATTITNVIWL